MSITNSLDLKMAQVDLYAHVFTVEYLDVLFGRLAASGYNAVLLAYRDKFPYTTDPELAGPDAYTPAEVARIEALLQRHKLQPIPLGHQFTHSAAILKHGRFKHLAGDGVEQQADLGRAIRVAARGRRAGGRHGHVPLVAPQSRGPAGRSVPPATARRPRPS